MKVLLKYSFIFDPADTYPNQYAFDSDIATFFRSKGLEAEIVQMPKVNGSSGNERMLIIKRLEDSAMVEATPKEKSIKEIRRDLTPNRGFDGKFRKL